MEQANHEQVAEEFGKSLLRFTKEYKKGGYFGYARDEFHSLYTHIKRLVRSVKISRMEGRLALYCSDIRDILALEYA